MKNIFSILLVAVVVNLVSLGCSKETETFNTEQLKEYFPLQVGRSYLYRLDSTASGNFGRVLVVRSYQAKDSIESTFTDNQGRLSYRIFRFLRDTAGLQPWTFNSTFYATAADNRIEYVDNNLRFIKLQAPIREGFRWKAHTFFDTNPASTNVGFFDNWEYEYQDLNQDYNNGRRTFSNTITILQQDETTPEGPFDPNLPFQQRNYGVEVYAKGVGLVYKDLLHWTWQSTKYEDASFGIRLTLISYQ